MTMNSTRVTSRFPKLAQQVRCRTVGYSEVTVGCPTETFESEKRVAVTPENVKLLLKEGIKQVLVQKGAGNASDMSDAQYEEAGATMVDAAAALSADVVLKVRPPSSNEVKGLKSGGSLISFINEGDNPGIVEELKAKKSTVFAIDRLPRTVSKAQAFDAMSSALGLMGYKAVVEAASQFPRPLAGKMTMAGKIPPAKVLVVGAAVAGLEAIQTAKNNGAQVFATDTRPEVEEQITSVGGKMLHPAGVKSEAGTGGYAKEQGADYYKAAADMYAKHVPDMDIVILTALIPGRPAPKIVTDEMVLGMKAGSVIVDLAAERGGNCTMTKPGEIFVTPNGVKIVGFTDLPSRMALQASKLYSNNLTKFLLYLNGGEKGNFTVNMEEEITRCTALLDEGKFLEMQMAKVAAPVAAVEEAEVVVADPSKDEMSRVFKTSIGLSLLVGAGYGAPASFVGSLGVFGLSVVIGYYVVWGVTHALHTPLMSVTNAISGLVAVGAMLCAGGGLFPSTVGQTLAAAAITISFINIVGGFRITQRMLNMFRRPTDPPEFQQYWLAPGIALPAAMTFLWSGGAVNMYEVGYLAASVFCIASLAALSSQTTARLGNTIGILGVSWGVFSAMLYLKGVDLPLEVFAQMGACAAIGGSIGLVIANKISPMDLPQLVAAFHSLVGMAAVLTCLSSHLSHAAHFATDPMAAIHLGSIFFGTIIGGITFTGSIVAYLKLNGDLGSGSLQYKGRDAVNIVMAISTTVLGGMYFTSTSMTPLLIASGISFVAGWHLVHSVGGADMPVCITVLNSYSGWALVCEGFMLNNTLLTVVGSLIGSSGAILTYIMCVAMNRSIWNVLFGSYSDLGSDEEGEDQGVAQETNVAETVALMTGASEVIIVPGFGLCQGQAQYAIAEMSQTLIDNGVNTRYGIHPVAGRMPGQLNVLLAEAGVPYDVVFEMDELNDDFANTDVALVVGANDVVNPDALTNPKSPLAGMPVLHVWKAKQSIVMKRSMATGYAGAQNPLFFMENNSMLFGNAKGVCESLLEGIKATYAK